MEEKELKHIIETWEPRTAEDVELDALILELWVRFTERRGIEREE